ncbi:MAG: hypothetical protein NT030_07340 [Candidatus Saganbacteria bacterium]|nr:hypothetical protein [Candidatus Saganbacteria bacterium]
MSIEAGSLVFHPSFSIIWDFWPLLAGLATLLGAAWAGSQLIEKHIFPRLKSTKLKKLYSMIEAWHDEIDQNLDRGLNLDLLANREKKIAEFIKKNGLSNHELIFSEKFRRKFLKDCGIKQELLTDKDLFAKYSRFKTDNIYIDLFWTFLIASFYKFRQKYLNGENANFADVEMPLKMLRMYLNIKE